MRKIEPSQIATFLILLALACTLAWSSTSAALGWAELGEYRPITTIAAFVFALYVFALLLFRAFTTVFPLPVGEIAEGSRGEFVYHVYLLFFLILFYPVIRSGFMPVPVMRLFYQALGAKLGANTYSSGLLLDPPFIRMGSNCIVGQFALLVPHVIEGRKLAHYPIVAGDNVTIGAGATVLSGVTIGNDAIVSTGAVVTKGTVIGDGEIWGGVPARLLGRRDGLAAASSNVPEGRVDAGALDPAAAAALESAAAAATARSRFGY